MCQRTTLHPPAHTRDQADAPRRADAEQQALDQTQSLDQSGLWPCRRIRLFLVTQQRPQRGPQQR